MAHHALCHQTSKWFIQIQIANAAEGAGEKPRIEKMQNRMFNTANILVHWHPICRGGQAKSVFMRWVGITQKIPRTLKKCIKRVLFAFGGAVTFWALRVFPAWMVGKRISGDRKINIFWQSDRQVCFWYRYRAA